MDNKPVTYRINEQGHAEIGGCDLTGLAKEYGTPLWVIDRETIVAFCREYREAFSRAYPKFQPLYASKALCTVATTQLIAGQGFGFDVVSGGELYTVLKAGVDPSLIYFHGNNKSPEELELAVTSGVGRVVVDNLHELARLESIAAGYGKIVSILFRITPEVDAHTHEFIQTGQLDSKFGLHRSNVVPAVLKAQEYRHIEVKGIHAHIGSQIFDVEPFVVAVQKLCSLALSIRERCGLTLSEINVGGGLGIKYLDSDDPADYAQFAQAISTALQNFCRQNDYPLPLLLIEPGRSIVANAGVTIYTVGAIKEVPEIRTYLAVDGGMADNARPITYGAVYDAVLAGKASLEATGTYRVAGKFCESGDILIKDVRLPAVEEGDMLCVFTTGAYNYSMSSNYNRFCKPAMVLVNNGKASLILKRESYEDIIRNDIPLEG